MTYNAWLSLTIFRCKTVDDPLDLLRLVVRLQGVGYPFHVLAQSNGLFGLGQLDTRFPSGSPHTTKLPGDNPLQYFRVVALDKPEKIFTTITAPILFKFTIVNLKVSPSP